MEEAVNFYLAFARIEANASAARPRGRFRHLCVSSRRGGWGSMAAHWRVKSQLCDTINRDLEDRRESSPQRAKSGQSMRQGSLVNRNRNVAGRFPSLLATVSATGMRAISPTSRHVSPRRVRIAVNRRSGAEVSANCKVSENTGAYWRDRHRHGGVGAWPGTRSGSKTRDARGKVV